MKQEIGLLVVFLLVFLYDLFAPRYAVAGTDKKAVKGISTVAVVLFAIFTAYGFCCSVTDNVQSVFGKMYSTTPVVATIKNILNIGVLIVLIQSMKWSASERRQCVAPSSTSFFSSRSSACI